MFLRFVAWLAYCACSTTCVPLAPYAARRTHWSTRLGIGLWGAVAWVCGCAIAFIYQGFAL